MRRGALFRFVLFACLTGLIPFSVRADRFYEYYERGEGALSEQRWSDATDQFLKAIQEKADSGASVRTYGMNFINYFPYLKLGIAYYNMGQYDDAIQNFDLEENFGAIEKSPGNYRNLQTFRQLAQDAKQAALQGEQQRIAAIVDESLKEARVLEEDGQLDAALEALSQALAVDRDNDQVLAVRSRLNGRIAEQEQERQRLDSVVRLIGEAESFMSAGDYEKASSVLNKALSLEPDDQGARSLLEEALVSLREQIQEQDESRRRAQVDQWMREAANQDNAGDYEAALQKLQSVLALDPDNPVALPIDSNVALPSFARSLSMVMSL